LHADTTDPNPHPPDRSLASERCIPCEAGLPPLSLEQAQALLPELNERWHLAPGGRSLTREITFKTFGRAMAFLNRLAEVAEAEGHHPDFCLQRWNRVSLTLTTHAIGGLSRNDFVLAAKLENVIRLPSDVKDNPWICTPTPAPGSPRHA
jgi:4a-hydroxytetrahydrobiopterin dehydratase